MGGTGGSGGSGGKGGKGGNAAKKRRVASESPAEKSARCKECLVLATYSTVVTE